MRRIGALALSVALGIGTLPPAAFATPEARTTSQNRAHTEKVPAPGSAASTTTVVEGDRTAKTGHARDGMHRNQSPGSYESVLDGLLEQQPSGGVLSARAADGERVGAARGRADKRTGQQARPHDRYRIGSNTKTMTAVVVLQLVEEGRLTLDDSVAELLPGFDLDPRITVRHLLQHTSGLHTETMLWQDTSSYEENRFRTFRPAELVRIALTNPEPRPKPGTEWEYSNTNYILAGMLVRKVTGNSLRAELNQRIFRPLKLRHTSFPVATPFMIGRHLRGYHVDGRDTTTYSMSYAWAAGAVVSTATEQTRFLRALLDGELLRPDTLATMLDPGKFGYGLGILPVELPCSGTAYGHDGAVFGYQSASFATRDGRAATIGVNAWITDEETGALDPAVVRANLQALCVAS